MKLFSGLKKQFNRKLAKRYYHRIINSIKRKPITSFLIVLAFLLVTIIAGSIITAPKSAQAPKLQPKSVQIYKIGVAPRITVQAKIEKSGVIKVTALSGGVVNSINVSEGENVVQGQNLVWLSNNYAGGNSLALSAQIAQDQYQNMLDTYQEQKNLIQRQKDLAISTQINAERLRNISNQSVEETRNLININEGILTTLGQNLSNYTATNSAGINDMLILQTRQLQSQFQNANNGLNQSLSSTEYQSSNSNIPADITNQQKDISIMQLNIQDKALDLNKEISGLQALIAQINAATMYPSAPFAGKVERVYVREGTAVNPGTPLILLSGNTNKVNAIALVSENIAKNISPIEESTLYIGSNSYSEHPFNVSTEATDGQSHSIGFIIPDNLANIVSDGDHIAISIPIGLPDTGQSIPFVPLDAIYQSQNQAYLFVVENMKAVSRNVSLGQVFGRFVEIKSGLESGDQVILDRNIVAGDPVNPNY